MFNKAFAAAIVAVVISAGCCARAMADDTAPDTAAGRYTLNKVVGGFVRLDTQTGTLQFCTERAVGWACEAAPEDRAAYEREIARLQNENTALKQALLAHGVPLPDDLMPQASSTPGNDVTIHLPDNAEIDRAMAYVKDIWQRLVEAVAKAQKEMLNKT
jgi:hypothetical protein